MNAGDLTAWECKLQSDSVQSEETSMLETVRSGPYQWKFVYILSPESVRLREQHYHDYEYVDTLLLIPRKVWIT